MDSRTRSRVLTAVTAPYGTTCIKYSGGKCNSGPDQSSTYNDFTRSGVYQQAYRTEEMTDVVTPGFKRLISEGKIINNPLIQTFTETSSETIPLYCIVTIEGHDCNPERWYVREIYELDGNLSFEEAFFSSLFISPPSLDVEDMKDRAMVSAQSKIGHTEILSLSALAELEKTVGGLIGLLSKVLKIARAAKLKHYKVLRQELKPGELRRDIADIYMNARYNLRPLYHDVKAIIRILTGDVHKPGRHTFRGYEKQSKTIAEHSDRRKIFSRTGWGIYANLTHNATTTTTVRAGVLTSSEVVRQYQIFGIDSIVESAWDLTPYSFILDWFFNVGDCIMAMTPNLGVKDLASWVTVDTTTTQKTIVESVYLDIESTSTYRRSGTLSSSPGACTSKIVRTKKRIPNYEPSYIPSFSLNIDPLKILDLGLILNGLRKNSVPAYARTM